MSWIRTIAPGATDREVLERAISEERILITLDKNFGELARSEELPEKCGIILLRVPTPPAPETARLALTIMARKDWSGRFSVVEPGRVRSRSLEVRKSGK